jgi:hypothetical protein
MTTVTETITVHRNGCLREWTYNFNTETLHDLVTGEVSQQGCNCLEVLKSDLKRQGFRFLPYNPNNIVMTPEQRQDFRNIFGY